MGIDRNSTSVNKLGLPNAGKYGYWSPVTSTLDWCEENYILTDYVAEYCIFSTFNKLNFER